MPEANANSLSASRLVSRAALRVMVIGEPQSGKSSLLGAFAQASQTQAHLLGGPSNDLDKELEDLQRSVYEDRPRANDHGLAIYPVLLQPPGDREEHASVAAVLVDFNATSAGDLLTVPANSHAGDTLRTVVETLLSADALIVTVDAAGTTDQMRGTFTAFKRFLNHLEQRRGQGAAVGGLPVFLVLTKCDLLADGKDTYATWTAQIEDRKRQAGEQFQEFLRRTNPVAFGRIDLRVTATAVRQPALADAPARPREPYQVAELFRDAFAATRGFRARAGQSSRRLFWTVAGSGLLAAGMLGLAIFLFVHRTQEDPRIRELITKIESYRMREPMTPSNRLRGQLQQRLSELGDLRNDPDFGKLPRVNQQYVTSRLGELQDYRTFHDQLMSLPPLTEVHSDKELTALENRLKNLAPAAEHQADWSQTEAVLFRAQQLDVIKALRSAVSADLETYRKLIRRGDELWSFAQEGKAFSWPDWNRQLQHLLEDSDAAQHRPSERVPGSEVTYETVLHFDSVAAAHAEWQASVLRLQRVSNLGAALGLGSAEPGRAPLDIPEGFAADQAVSREQRLRRAYPRFQKELTLVDLPDSITSEIRSAARSRYERLVKAGREAVLRRLQETGQSGESYENWRQLRSWLESPAELQAWRVLATVLARLQWADAEDPVTALANFLKKEQFDLTANRLVLEIPDEQKIRPAGRLLIHHGKAGEANAAELVFEPLDNGRSDPQRQATRYTFKPVGASALTYRPGDNFWADVPVQSADSPDWMLTWTAGRSQVYQFERLTQPPRLHRKDQSNLEGKVEPRITLQIAPDGGVPKVPDLLPIVPAK